MSKFVSSAEARPVKVAAGVIALRGTGEHREVLAVHRPAYDDWTLPKGHVESGEQLPQTAVREFTEETGHKLACLGSSLGVIEYPLASADKRVHWWLGRASEEPPLRPSNPKEIDRVSWIPIPETLTRFSYDDELEMLERALSAPHTVPLVIVRHAKALSRKTWHRLDSLRPLSERGREQAAALKPLLDAFCVRMLASSTSTRCLETFEPSVNAKKPPYAIESIPTLSEEQAEHNPELVRATMRRLRIKALEAGCGLAVCGHRPVLPEMLDALSIEHDTEMKPAEMVIAHLNPRGQVVATEDYPSLL
jgi:8-oxo-dGTP diphosphatase